jgi:hypothetical protein
LTGFDTRKTEIRNVNKVGVSQTARRTRFPLETLDKLRVAHKLRRDEFQGNVTFGAEVSGEIHSAHSALAEEMLEAIFVVKNFADVFKSMHEPLMLTYQLATDKRGLAQIRHETRIRVSDPRPSALLICVHPCYESASIRVTVFTSGQLVDHQVEAAVE